MSKNKKPQSSNSKDPSPRDTPSDTSNKMAAQPGAETVMKGSVDEFAKMAKKMVNNKEFSDLKFLIGPGRKAIYAHRCILSARCAVFKAMFADKVAGGHDRDVPLVLSDMSPDVFLAMLDFIYTNTVAMSAKNAIDLLATSLEYGLDDLRDLCVEYMDANLTPSNACDVMQAAVTYNQNDLKEKTIVYIEDNSVEVFKSKSMQEISEDTLVSILRSSRLNMDEMDLYKAVKEWATVNGVINGRKIHEVAREAIKHIRLPLLSAEELTTLEDESKKDAFMPVGLFAYAWKLHALKQGDKDNILAIRRRGTSPREHHKFFTDSNFPRPGVPQEIPISRGAPLQQSLRKPHISLHQPHPSGSLADIQKHLQQLIYPTTGQHNIIGQHATVGQHATIGAQTAKGQHAIIAPQRKCVSTASRVVFYNDV